MGRTRSSLPCCVVVVLTSVACQGALLRGYIDIWGSPDCNPCVPDVARAVDTLRVYGDILGFHLGAAIPDFDEKTLGYAVEHWQGVQRLAGPNNQYLVATRSRKDYPMAEILNEPGGFAVVHMASRDRDGRRYRSNRHGFPDVQDVSPPEEDRVISYTEVNEGYTHAGGIQTIGNWLVVPIEGGPGDANARVLFYDLTNPASPQKASYEVTVPSETAGTVAITKVQDGKFLLIVGGANCDVLHFYLSNGTSLATDPQFELEWSVIKAADFDWPAYQNTNLVTQADGQLYLIGLHNDGLASTPTGDDWVDAWRLELDPQNVLAMRLVKVANRNVHSRWGSSPYPLSGIPAQCNLDAAAGVYVDPDGRLIVYATEHGANGPDGTVKMMEFRNQLEPTSCGTIDEGWVELYDDDNWRDRGLMIDFLDRGEEAYDDFDYVEGFGDKTSSARWCLPPGYRCVLFEDHGYEGSTLNLTGSGSLKDIANFDDHHFGDKTSSCHFEGKYGDTWLPLLTMQDWNWLTSEVEVGPYGFYPFRLVGGTLRVKAGKTLSILPGMTLVFKAGSRIVADGTLIADGTKNPIVFLSENDEGGQVEISSKLVIKNGGEIRLH
jgi:hypothetical protein